jgi:hypothetical protein
LEFQDGSCGWFNVTGAIVFPKGLEHGFSLLAIQDQRTKTVIVVEQCVYQLVQSRVVDDCGEKKIEKGLAFWCYRMWEKYAGFRYYVSGDNADMTYHRYRLQLLRAPELQKIQPHLIPVNYGVDANSADRIIYEAYLTGKYMIPEGSPIDIAMQLHATQPHIKIEGKKQEVKKPEIDCFRLLMSGAYRFAPPVQKRKSDVAVSGVM